MNQNKTNALIFEKQTLSPEYSVRYHPQAEDGSIVSDKGVLVKGQTQ